MLEQVLQELADEICTRNGYPKNFDIILSNDLDYDKAITLVGGSVPIIYVNRLWILEAMVKANAISNDTRAQRSSFHSVKDKLHRAIEKVPKMTRSLALLTVREAITLRRDARRWALDTVPQMKSHLRERFFEIEYNIQITIKETSTHTSVTRNITDIEMVDDTIREIKSTISRSIISNEEMSELRSIAEAKLDNQTNPINPIKIHISSDPSSIKETNEY
jgi:hypothetical protein